jgi:predicted nucleotidyltransferase
MRLTDAQRQQLREQLARQVGDDCEFLVFGSRLRDDVKGGDLDLLVRSPRPVEQRVYTEAYLGALAERVMDGRKVDLLLIDPNTTLYPIHRAALQTGKPL